MPHRDRRRRHRTCLSVALVASLLAAAVPLGTIAAEQDPRIARALAYPHAPDRLIVGFEPGNATSARRSSARVPGVASIRRVSPLSRRSVVVELAPGSSLARAMVQIGGQEGVAYVEPDYLVEAAETADDPWYTDGDHWGMYGSDTVPHANPFGSGAGAAWRQGFVGSDRVHVGIIDEGIKVDHPDLAANIWTNPAETVNGLDDDDNGYVDDVHGWDFVADDPTVYDGTIDDHGTHVAGTVGARGGNGIGVAGVGWRVTLIPAKFLGARGGYISDAVRAIDYITDLTSRHDLDIVATNNSWTGGGYSQALADAIDRAGDAGILFVAAAGNDGRDIDATPAYPAAHRCTTHADGSARGWDCVISVANLTSAGARNSKSNWGRVGVSLGAPGTTIVSTHPVEDGYAYYSGTSTAAPHVTGALALCASLDPSLRARDLAELILDTVAPTESMTGSTASGGRLDIGALVERCAPAPPPTGGTTVYVDDLDPEFRRFGTGWNEATTGLRSHAYWTGTRDDKRTRFASWKPQLPAAGRYLVMAWIPGSNATSRKATYRIKGARGWVSRVRSQYKRRGSWASLGEHDLTATPIVQLADNTGEPAAWGRRLAFDAVRFIYVDGWASTAHGRRAGHDEAPRR